MAIVYNSRYTGDFCDKYGNNVYITLKHRDDSSFVPPTPIRIKFVGHDESPVVISYKEPDNDYKLQPINGSECKVNIIADDYFELSDLYTADEKEWLLEITGARSWSGFVIPDSCSEPFKYKPYQVTISATDGLGLLKDVPYCNDDGTRYTGFESDRDVLRKAVTKTGLYLGMDIGVNTYDYIMFNFNRDPLSQAFIDQARFIDEDGNPFSCYEVIRSICARWSARLHQHNGRWQIINAMELSRGSVKTFKYDSLGTFLNSGEIVNTIIAGGLNRDIQPVGNTQLAKAFKQSIGYYQYGYIANQLFNGDMNLWTNKPIGLSDGWSTFGSITVTATTKIRQNNGQNTTDYYIEFNDTGQGGITNNNPVQIRANETAQVVFDLYSSAAINGSSNSNSYISVLLQSDNGKYFTNTGWQTGFGYYVISKKKTDYLNQISVNFNIDAQPFDYQVTFSLLPVGDADGDHWLTQINNVSVKPNADTGTKTAIGSYTLLESTTSQSYKPEPIVLLHADDGNEERTSLIRIGSAESTSHPTGWHRVGMIGENKRLTELVADTEIRLHSRPYKIFDAVFYGYDDIDINTLLSVDLLGGNNLMFLSGDFDLKTGNHSLRFAEVLLDDVPYIETTAQDYGDISDKNNVGSPTGVSGTSSSSYVDTSGLATNAQLGYFIDNINSPIPIKHVWFGTTAERNALTTVDPYTYYVLTDSLTPVLQAASNVETQAGTVTDKYVAPSTLANWWAYVRGVVTTISAVWNFTSRPTYNGAALITAADIPKGSDNVLNKTAAYTVLMSDFGTNGQVTIYVDTTSGNIAITLPNAATMNGYTVNVVKTTADVNSVTVVGMINGITNDTLSNAFDAGSYRSNGNNIFVF